MSREGQVNPGSMWIRVFYPNPIPGTYQGNPLNLISTEYEVSYLYKLDPIYHELVFSDTKGIRHSIIGLAYHMRETLAESGGVDASI
jgi:hypothetical protein